MYGRVRMGGTIGWGVAAPIAGVVIGRYGLPWAFWSYAILMFIGFIVSQKFVFNPVKQETSYKNGLQALLSNKRFVLFSFHHFVCGMAFMSINSYLLAYMEQLGINKTLMGLALGIATLSNFHCSFSQTNCLLDSSLMGC